MADKIQRDPDKVARIATAAVSVFAQNDYHTASTDAVAQGAGVSKGLVFRYYGSKAELYVAAVEAATAHLNAVKDVAVWQDATDLVALVSRAVRYKMQLQVTYPDEFKLLLRAYGGTDGAPQALHERVQAGIRSVTADLIGPLLTPVLAHMKLRPDVDVHTVIQLVQGVMGQTELAARAMMATKPNATLADFDAIVQHVRAQMMIVERGIVKR